jgi:hypothetical protein
MKVKKIIERAWANIRILEATVCKMRRKRSKRWG